MRLIIYFLFSCCPLIAAERPNILFVWQMIGDGLTLGLMVIKEFKHQTLTAWQKKVFFFTTPTFPAHRVLPVAMQL